MHHVKSKICSCVTNSRAKPQKPRRWKSMLIHQGWFTVLYTQHLLDSQSLEFEICIFPREAIPSHYFPPPRRLAPSLGLGTTWVRQLRSGSCHHPTAATKCNEQPSQATETPSVEKHAHPPTGFLWLNSAVRYTCMILFQVNIDCSICLKILNLNIFVLD